MGVADQTKESENSVLELLPPSDRPLLLPLTADLLPDEKVVKEIEEKERHAREGEERERKSRELRASLHPLQSSQSLSPYRDRRFPGTQDEFEQALQTSTIVYVGNLSFYTTEEQIYDLFSRCGEIKKIIMGLDKNSKTPCGFCFVMYYTREDTEDAVKYISGTVLDERPIRVDFDWGFQEGRQWGRGKSGGQVRDEYRTDYDPGRGGYGKLVQRELESHRQLVDYTGNLGSYYNTGGSHGHGSSHRSESGYKRRRGDDDYRSSERYRRDRESRAEKNPRFRERRDSDDEDSSRH